MGAESEWLMAGVHRATLALGLGAALLIVRWVVDGLRRALRRGLGAAPGEWRRAEPLPPRVARVQALIFAAVPVGLGLFRAIHGHFTARVGGRSHPNPPIYLYEGAVARANAAGWILVGVAVYVALAGWSSRRWRWPAAGLACACFYAGFIAFAGADAHAVKVR